MVTLTEIPQGNTQIFEFIFVDKNKAPVDITGWRIVFTAKINEEDPDNLAVINVDTTAGSDANDNLLGGIMYLTVDSTDSNITKQKYHYDFKRIIAGSPPSIRTLDIGTFKITNVIRISNA